MNRHFTILIMTFTSAKVDKVYWHCVFVQITPWIRFGLWYWAPGISKHFYWTYKPGHFNAMAFPLGLTINMNATGLGVIK